MIWNFLHDQAGQLSTPAHISRCWQTAVHKEQTVLISLSLGP